MAGLDGTILPPVMAELAPGDFGNYEARQTRYGALNLLERNATKLFGPKVLNLIQTTPPGRDIKIPIFARGNEYTVLTTRSCDIACPTDETRLKTLTFTHMRVEICLNQDDYNLNYVTDVQALKDRFVKAFRALYTLLDASAAAFVDSNKSTNIAADPGGGTPNANPLYTAKAGLLEFKNSVQFYSYLPTVMEMMDVHAPYMDLANTIVNADKTMLANPGGGTQLATDKLMRDAGIDDYDFSNRVASGSMVPTHYIMPIGSVGVANRIDPVYTRESEVGSQADIDFWNSLKGLTDVTAFRWMRDPNYNLFKWGVLQKTECTNEQKLYKAAFSADFCFGVDFTSTTGLTPIKKMTVAQLYQPTYPA